MLNRVICNARVGRTALLMKKKTFTKRSVPIFERIATANHSRICQYKLYTVKSKVSTDIWLQMDNLNS